MPVSLTFFDGAGTIGGNKIYLEYKDGEHAGKGLFFDFGTNFAATGSYYEEFLVPRTARGIHDMLSLGLIPNISCYRDDLCPSDVGLADARNLDPMAILISHAHMDHIGNIGLLDGKIPVIATPVTLAIMKAMQDCGGSMESEVSYLTPRQQNEDDGRIIGTIPAAKKNYQGRDCYLACGCASPAGFAGFWESQPTTRKLDAGAAGELADFPGPAIRAFEVNHSIYGAAAFAVESGAGWIVYSGDLRRHGAAGKKTDAFVQEAKKLKPRVLIIEGTRAARKPAAGGKAVTEEDVTKACLAAVKDAKKLVVADFSARNLERLDMFRSIAEQTGRSLVVTIKDAYVLDALIKTDGIDRLAGIVIYRDLKAARDGFEKKVMEDYADQLRDPADIANEPEKYICCFSFFDVKHLLDIRPEGGTYIYSSSEAYGEEQKIDFMRLNNWLKKFGFEIRGFSVTVDAEDKITVRTDPAHHASGHAAAEEIIAIINEIHPGTVIPIHTENPDFLEGKVGDIEIIPPENGKEYEFS